MIYWERGTEVCGGSCRIGHLVYVEIIAPHWGGVLKNYLCRWYDLHPGGRFFLQRKALGFNWDLNPAICSTTHTQPCLSHLYLFDKTLIVKEDPTLNFSCELRRAKVQSLGLIGAMDIQKNDVPTDIFIQGNEKPLARGRKTLWKYSARGAKSQPKPSHSADLDKLTIKCLPQGKVS